MTVFLVPLIAIGGLTSCGVYLLGGVLGLV